MKFHILLLFLLLVPTAFAQSPAADIVDSWKTYKFDNGRYSINMPVQPQEEVEKVGSDSYKFDLFSQTAETETSVYNLSYVNFGISNNDDEYVSGVLDSWEKGVLESMPDSAIKTEKIEFQGAIARRVVAEGKLVRLDGIALYREGRLIHMALGVAADPSDEAAAAKNLQHADKFFRSFQYNEVLETPISGPVDEVRTLKSGTVFKSEEYGFQLTLPEGWTVLGGELVKKAFELSTADKRISANTKKDLEASFDKTEILFSLSKTHPALDQNAAFVAGVEPLTGNGGGTAKEIADATYQHFLQNLAYQPVEPPKLVSIHELSFYRFKVKKEFDGKQLNQHFYLRRLGRRTLQFVLTFTDDSFFEDMQKSLETVKSFSASP